MIELLIKLVSRYVVDDKRDSLHDKTNLTLTKHEKKLQQQQQPKTKT